MMRNPNILLSALFLIALSFSASKAQNSDQIIINEREKVIFSSFGLGIHTLGLSEFNKVFQSLNLPTTPASRFAFYYSRMSLPVNTMVFSGFSIASQNYIVVNETPGEISYTFAKQNMEFNAGLFIFENEILAVPLYGGAGLSFMIFNSYTNFNNIGKDFADVLVDGSGTGIFNMAEISINGSLVTGLDVKIAHFRRKASSKNKNLNIGIRTGVTYAAFQLPTAIADVSNVPQTDRLNYFVSLNVTRFVFPCKSE